MSWNKKVSYLALACDHWPFKSEPWVARAVVGVNFLDYHLDSGSPATDMLEAKLLINSTISDAEKEACFCSMDHKDVSYKQSW